jgi:hypothetical protein
MLRRIETFRTKFTSHEKTLAEGSYPTQRAGVERMLAAATAAAGLIGKGCDSDEAWVTQYKNCFKAAKKLAQCTGMEIEDE